MPEAASATRLERILGVPLAKDAVRQWPQSGEVIRGRARIAEVESHFVGLRLEVGRRHACGDSVVVEWSTDYGDGRVYRNVSIAELQQGKAVRVTDYWGEPFTPPASRPNLGTKNLLEYGSVLAAFLLLMKAYGVANFSLTTTGELITTAPLRALLGTLASYGYLVLPLIAVVLPWWLYLSSSDAPLPALMQWLLQGKRYHSPNLSCQRQLSRISGGTARVAS